MVEALDYIFIALDAVNQTYDISRGISARKSLSKQEPSETFLQEAPNPRLEWSADFFTRIYCGKKFVRKLVGSGTFLCPVCEHQQSYKQKELMLYCHLYWMLLCCGAHIGDYIKCAGCKNHFNVNVLDWAQGPQQAKKAFERAVLDATVLFMLAMGRALDGSELDKIRQTHGDVTNMTTADFMANYVKLKHASEDDNDFMKFFIELSYHLSQDQKDIIIMAVVGAALADGEPLNIRATSLLAWVGKGLGVNKSRIEEILQDEQHQHPCKIESRVKQIVPAEHPPPSKNEFRVKQIVPAEHQRPSKNESCVKHYQCPSKKSKIQGKHEHEEFEA